MKSVVAMSRGFSSFSDAIPWSIQTLRDYGTVVDSGHWQGVATEGRADMETKELINLNIYAPIPADEETLAFDVTPNLPWAEDHFLERVGREPTNPGVQYRNWPWWRGQDEDTMLGGQFTHTYQERFWPKEAGSIHGTEPDDHTVDAVYHRSHFGIRYFYGDLDDVVNLLRRYPQTRQATFPIFFPEDTGAVHGGRVPCTLHYHFLLRNNRLNLFYPIRSCDAVRHFRDDLYMAGRLCQWVLEELREPVNSDDEGNYPWQTIAPGFLYFTAYSFHVHRGDEHLL